MFHDGEYDDDEGWIMRRFALLIMTLALAIGIAPIASASSLSIGTISYDSTVIKDGSFTVQATITASGVGSTITVTATLQDKTGGAVSIQSADQVKTYSSNTSQTFTWSVTASNPGTYSNPFTVQASASDGGSATKTATTTLTIQDRPTLSLTLSPGKTTVNAGDTVRLDYTITNGGGGGAADATGVSAALTLPGGWSRTGGGANPYSIGTISPGASKSGYWILTASSPGSTNTLTVTVTSTVPGGTVVDSCAITGPTTSTTGSPGGGGTYPLATPAATVAAAPHPTAPDGTAPTSEDQVTPAEPAVSEKATPVATVKAAAEKPAKKSLPGFAGVSAVVLLIAVSYLIGRGRTRI